MNKGIVNLVLCKLNFWYQWALYIQYNTYSYCEARLKNMLVSHHLGLFFEYTQPTGKKKYHLEMGKIALILIYLTWFWSSLLHSTSCVYFFCNVDATIMNLVYLNPHNPQLAG